MIPVLSALAAAGLLAACGSESGSGGSAAPDHKGDGSVESELTGVHWNVDSVRVDGEKHTAPAAAGAYVEFDGKGRAEGRYGCNSVGAKATIKGDTIQLGKPTTTLMGCGESVMKFEETLARALVGSFKADVDGNRLTLTTPKGDRVDLTSEPDVPLTATTWRVNSVGDGRTAASLPEPVADKVRLTFGKDGTVRGNLGCNDVTATARAADGHITLGTPRTTRKMCPGPVMQTERKLLKLFGGKVSYELAHRSLTLTSADGSVVVNANADLKQNKK